MNTTSTGTRQSIRTERHLALATALSAGPDQAVFRAVARHFDPVASLYARLDVLGEDARDLRWRQTAARLLEGGASEDTVETLHARLLAWPEEPAVLVAFATADGRLLHELRLTGAGVTDAFGDLVDWSAPARLVPALAWADAHPPYVLAVVDRAGGDVTSCAGGGLPAYTETVDGPEDELGRNVPGSWSQPEYRRHSEESWRRNAERVAQHVTQQLEAVAAQVLVLSGDVHAMAMMTERLHLPPGLLVEHITGSRSPDGSQATRGQLVDTVLHTAAAEQTRSLLEHLHAHLEPGGVAVDGDDATLEALAAGRVATLLVTDALDTDRVAWFGASPTEVYASHRDAVVSDQPVRQGRLVDVAVRSALLGGARVRVVPAGSPGGLTEDIAALCRYGTTATEA
jgi:hypothetical protein